MCYGSGCKYENSGGHGLEGECHYHIKTGDYTGLPKCDIREIPDTFKLELKTICSTIPCPDCGHKYFWDTGKKLICKYCKHDDYVKECEK